MPPHLIRGASLGEQPPDQHRARRGLDERVDPEPHERHRPDREGSGDGDDPLDQVPAHGEVLETQSELHLVTDGKSIYLEDEHARIIDLMKNAQQPMFLVCVTDQVRRLEGPAARKPARSAETAAVRKRKAVS